MSLLRFLLWVFGLNAGVVISSATFIAIYREKADPKIVCFFIWSLGAALALGFILESLASAILERNNQND